MARLFMILLGGGLAAAVVTVCYGVVLLKLVQREGVAKGALGLACPPFTYAWGWRHVRRARTGRRCQWMTAWMTAWTAAALYLVAGSVFLELEMT